jgi:hypothetical protein
MRVITFTDFVHECGNPECAELAIQEFCPCFELVDYQRLDEVPTVGELIRLLEEERKQCA